MPQRIVAPEHGSVVMPHVAVDGHPQLTSATPMSERAPSPASPVLPPSPLDPSCPPLPSVVPSAVPSSPPSSPTPLVFEVPPHDATPSSGAHPRRRTTPSDAQRAEVILLPG